MFCSYGAVNTVCVNVKSLMLSVMVTITPSDLYTAILQGGIHYSLAWPPFARITV